MSVGEDTRGPEGRDDVPWPHGRTCRRDLVLPLGPTRTAFQKLAMLGIPTLPTS